MFIRRPNAYRKKFVIWQRNMEKFELMDMEFQVISETKASLKPFVKEIEEKMEHMKDFKKTWNRFVVQTESMLKKEVCLPAGCPNGEMQSPSNTK